jgi:rod shape-determining protein MreD
VVLKAVTAPTRQRGDNAAARLLPIVTTLMAMIISIQPAPIPGYAAVAPAFTLMTVYHWTIYRPKLLPPLSVFLIGVTQDLLTGTPSGINALVMLLARAIVLQLRRHFVNRSFPFVWTGFTMLSGGAMLFLWALHCLLDRALIDFRGTIFRAVLTISLFPAASFLLGRTQRSLMSTG